MQGGVNLELNLGLESIYVNQLSCFLLYLSRLPKKHIWRKFSNNFAVDKVFLMEREASNLPSNYVVTSFSHDSKSYALITRPLCLLLFLCQQVCKAIRSGQYPFVMCNFAPPDMVGHTGKYEPAIKGCEATG